MSIEKASRMVHRGDPDRRRPTLRDVAREAGVSLMTVSNVVNGRFGELGHETRERVEQTIAAMGYQPRGTARGLRLDRNFAVGIMIVDPLSSFLADPFISQVVAGLSNHLSERNYGCLVHGVTPQHFERSIFLGDSRVDGICAFLSGDADTRRGYLERLLALKTPVVGIEDTNIGLDPDLAVVHQDDFGAAVRLTRRLLEGGSRNLFVLAPAMPWPSVTERLAGMESEVLRSGDDVRLTVVTCGTGTISEAHAVVPATLGNKLPERSALIGVSDRLAIAAARLTGALYRAGKADVRVASFSASEASRDLGLFDLVALSDPYRIGVESGQIILDRIEAGSFAIAELVVPVEVIEGI